MLMYLNKKRQKGQSTLEYAILIIIIVGALLSIQVYIKRGVQGRLKSATDDIGDQFSPGNTDVVRTRTVNSRSQDTFQAGVTQSTLLSNEVSNETTTSGIINDQQEYWGSAEDRAASGP